MKERERFGLTWSEIALDVCSAGGASDAGVVEGTSSERNGTRLVYFSMYASSVSVSVEYSISIFFFH